MFAIDDRTGNVVTTVVLFLIVATVLYRARGAFFVLLLSLFFAYLLEPAVTLVQQHSKLGSNESLLGYRTSVFDRDTCVGHLGHMSSGRIL